MSSSSRLDQSDLLNEQVHADELQELLARLAATDALFAEPIPTIRDVAEATDASPLLIGRILSQIRGPDGIAALRLEIKDFAERLKTIEAALTSTPSVTTQSFVSPESEVVPSPTLPEAPTTKSLGHPKSNYHQSVYNRQACSHQTGLSGN